MAKMCYSKNCSVYCKEPDTVGDVFIPFFPEYWGYWVTVVSICQYQSMGANTEILPILCLVSALRKSKKHFRAKAFFSFSNILEIIAQSLNSLKCVQ